MVNTTRPSARTFINAGNLNRKRNAKNKTATIMKTPRIIRKMYSVLLFIFLDYTIKIT